MGFLAVSNLVAAVILVESHFAVISAAPLHCFLCRYLVCSKGKLAVCVGDGCKCMKLVDIYSRHIKLGYPYPGFVGPKGEPTTTTTTTTTAAPCLVAVSGPSSVEVPCGCSESPIDGANLTLTNSCSFNASYNYVDTELIYRSNSDSAHLIAVDPTTGILYRSFGAIPTENTTHVYQFRLTAIPGLQNATALNVTFHFGSCVLGLVGPSSVSVCPGYPPGSTEDPSGRPYNLYPQLTFTATNVPPLMPLAFDVPSDGFPVYGLGAPATGTGNNFGLNSPAVLPGSIEPEVFISNLNQLAGQPSTNTIGIYGAGNNGNLPCVGAIPTTVTTDPVTGAVTGSCCQDLLFSVSPGLTDSPYQPGQKQVKVCYESYDTCDIL